MASARFDYLHCRLHEDESIELAIGGGYGGVAGGGGRG